jgi:hypothetical protein
MKFRHARSSQTPNKVVSVDWLTQPADAQVVVTIAQFIEL